MTWGSQTSAVVVAVLALVVLSSTLFYVFGGARDPLPAPFTGFPGDPEAGRLALARLGCTACHAIEGVRAPGGRVGPSLDRLTARRMIAGRLPNTPENAVRFILDPQGVSPGSAMPDLRVVEAEARDMVAYLYGLGGR
jgi:cytochrome c